MDNTRFTEDFYDPTTYAFSALLELEGLKESQSGNYTCHKWDNVSYSASYHIFVPGGTGDTVELVILLLTLKLLLQGTE